METVQNVLVVANSLTHQNVLSVKRAKESSSNTIKLNLVYIIPPIPACYHQIPSIGGVETDLYSIAKNKLKHIGNMLKIEENHQWLISGPIKAEARKLAGQLNSQVIIMVDIASEPVIESLFYKVRQFFMKNPSEAAFVIPDKSKRSLTLAA